MDAREINKAIAAHGVWKLRLREAIESGSSEYRPETVALDSACDFGKWLHSIPDADRPEEYWVKADRLHKAFHAEAGRILKLALDEFTQEALASVSDLQGQFVITSIELTNTLYAWKKAVMQSTGE